MLLTSCRNDPTDFNMPQPMQSLITVPPGFSKPPVPKDNPLTSEKIQLGRRLFYEVKLSRDNSLSCSGCHQQANGFSDAGQRFSRGVQGAMGTRNAPSLVNLAYDTSFFWDGRAHTLEQQAIMPITNPVEMASDTNSVVAKLSADSYYLSLFKAAFGDSKVTVTRIGQALASFERTLISGNSPYDRYKQGDLTAMSASAIRGMKLFEDTNATNCTGCHSGENFTDDGYYSTGFQQEYYGGDLGRAAITNNDKDRGKFKTPTLRNVALSAPYAVNGGTATLFEMVSHYNDGGFNTTNQDRRIHRLNLSTTDMADLVAFMEALTDKEFITNKNFRDPNSSK